MYRTFPIILIVCKGQHTNCQMCAGNSTHLDCEQLLLKQTKLYEHWFTVDTLSNRIDTLNTALETKCLRSTHDVCKPKHTQRHLGVLRINRGVSSNNEALWYALNHLRHHNWCHVGWPSVGTTAALSSRRWANVSLTRSIAVPVSNNHMVHVTL